ncbi:MAG: MBG domain-containing protein [Oscillospiraceae bacterium]|nr:MBG domain-containing protein [Oscillospiraceae bacterium]
MTGVPLTPNKNVNNYAGVSFNENADAFLRDAEGNYRYDSVIVGTAVNDEPDLSGAAAWALHDYITEGYGFITGHDMMYAYGGTCPNPNYVPDKASTVTPYYQYNTRINGHWNMNWLMGVNKTYTEASPYEAPTMVLSAGDYRDKSTLYGEIDGVEESRLRIKTYPGAPVSVTDRAPTNYPYNEGGNGVTFSKGYLMQSHSTHSNQQLAYGTVWVDFVSNSLSAHGAGLLKEDKRADGQYGTNNFYLTTNGNLALNQVGHIIQTGDNPNAPKIYYDESRIMANTILYVSQRQQCQICQSEQGGSGALHFVHRIYTAEDLAKIGDPAYVFTHPLDGCYRLAANITLPDDWKPIEGFRGHFHADNYGGQSGQATNYRVTLGANGAPVFANDTGKLGEHLAGSGAGWNLGADRAKGLNAIENARGERATGVARVSGQLHLLLGGAPADWANCIVVIKGSDGNDYWCKTNMDGKYVISNLPCTGVMEARVYRTKTYTPGIDATGTGIPENGKLRVNVPAVLWDTDDTTELYLRGFHALPIADVQVYDGETAVLQGAALYSEALTNVQWLVKLPGADAFIPIAESGLAYEAGKPKFIAEGEASRTEATLAIKDACVRNTGLQVCAVFTTPDGEAMNTFDAATPGNTGKVTVLEWPVRVTEPQAVQVWADGTATFTSSAEAKGGLGSGMKVQWQIRRWDVDEWTDVTAYGPLNDGITRTKVNTVNGGATGDPLYPARTQTTLTITNTPQAVNGMYVRAVYTYTGVHTAHAGTVKPTGDHAAMITVLQPKIGAEWVAGQGGRKGMSFENPLLCAANSEYSQETAVYEADVTYVPGAADTSEGSPSTDVLWRYKTTDDPQSIVWNQASANALAARLGVKAPKVTITTGQPVRQADGTYKIHTKMTVTNVHWRLYSDDCFISFSAQATNHYKTSPYEDVTAETYRMPLVIDYKVGLKWNAGSPTNHGSYTEWTYPSATVNSAAGVKTLLIEFDATQGGAIDGRDAIITTGAPSGMRAAFTGQQYVLFVSDKAVSQAVIEQYLRKNVKVRVYDTKENPKVWAYINAEKNLGTSQLTRAAEAFTAAVTGTRAVPNLTIGWSATHFFVGGSAVAHASRTDAGYYQWQVNTGTGWRNLAYENRPTLSIGSLSSNMTGWKYRLRYGASASDAGMKTSNELTLSFGFTNIAVGGESVASDTRMDFTAYGNTISIPAKYAPYVTSVSFDWVGTSDRDPYGDATFRVGAPGRGDLFRRQGFSAYNAGHETITLTGGKGLTGLYAIAQNTATAVVYTHTMRVYNVRISGVGDFQPGSGLVMKRGAHDAWDITTVWHEDKTPQADVTAAVTAQSKIYDGAESMAAVRLTDRGGLLSDAQLDQILARGTVQYSSGATTPSNAKSGSGCIDVGSYTAVFVPAEQDALYFSANNAADIENRKAAFSITARPVYLYSYGNDKEYDGTDAAVISHIDFKPFDRVKTSGVVPADAGKVAVNPDTAAGTYQGYVNQTNGGQIPIIRLPESPLALAGERAHNYYIAGEDYTGAITPRKLHVHSLYQDPADTPNNPRNVKQYDGTADAVIEKILVDNILPGDKVWVDAKTYAGQYADKNAGETLNPDGTTLEDRLNRLEETAITRTGPMTLINNELGNYVIGSEEYSGAIYRRTIDALVKNQAVPYGQGYEKGFAAAPAYTAQQTGQNGYDLVIDAMWGDDVLKPDAAKSGFVTERAITPATPVGAYSVRYEGLTEENYPVLTNYIVLQRAGSIVVTPAELLICVDGGYEKAYGEENPAFSVRYEGFVNGDTAETALEGEPSFYTLCGKDSPVRYNADGSVGVYGVSAGGLTAKTNENGGYNYTLRYESGTIKVLPREVRLIADPHEKVYGDPDPAPSYRIEGGVVKQDELKGLTLTREEGEDVGRYQYLFDEAQLTISDRDNYTIIYVPDDLTITPAELIITANDASRPLKTPNPAFTVQYSGFKRGEGPAALTGELQFICEAGYASPVGKYPITPYGLESGNYTIQYVDGTLTVYDGAGLLMKKSADRDVVLMGGTVTYTITVTNNGERVLDDVLVQDEMTGITGEITPLAGDGYRYLGGGRFSIPHIDMGQTVVIRYTYTALNTDMGGTVIKNAAFANVPDSEKTFRTGEVNVLIDTRRDLAITKTADKETAKENETVRYTLRVTNTGNVPAKEVTVRDVMDTHRSPLTVKEDPAYTFTALPGGSETLFTLTKALQPGETVEIVYTMAVLKPDANAERVLSNTATAVLPADGSYPEVRVSDSWRLVCEGNGPYLDFMAWLDANGAPQKIINNNLFPSGCIFVHDGRLYMAKDPDSLEFPWGTEELTVQNVQKLIDERISRGTVVPIKTDEDGYAAVYYEANANLIHKTEAGAIWVNPVNGLTYICRGYDSGDYGPGKNWAPLNPLTHW